MSTSRAPSCMAAQAWAGSIRSSRLRASSSTSLMGRAPGGEVRITSAPRRSRLQPAPARCGSVRNGASRPAAGSTRGCSPRARPNRSRPRARDADRTTLPGPPGRRCWPARGGCPFPQLTVDHGERAGRPAVVMEAGALPRQPAEQPHLMVLAALQPLIPALALGVPDQAGPFPGTRSQAHEVSEPGLPPADFSVREKYPSYPIVIIGIWPTQRLARRVGKFRGTRHEGSGAPAFTRLPRAVIAGQTGS